MAYEMLVGLNVTDDTQYQKYREAMMPILESYGGRFEYDFKISEVLLSPTDEPINRIFTIRFANEDNKDRFFFDPTYVQVRDKYFLGAVESTTIIAAYEI
ncbi:MAG: DUF1330 domain-containing protein [Elainellaceae cyanobacterium]